MKINDGDVLILADVKIGTFSEDRLKLDFTIDAEEWQFELFNTKILSKYKDIFPDHEIGNPVYNWRFVRGKIGYIDIGYNFLIEFHKKKIKMAADIEILADVCLSLLYSIEEACNIVVSTRGRLASADEGGLVN